jgi:hypothetical protein
MTSALLLQAWRRFFRALPGWLLFPAVLLAGLAYPLPWVLDGPRIYEASILFGAAFLMAGLVGAFPILTGEVARPARLVVVGLMWGLAFTSRAVLIFPIAAFLAASAGSCCDGQSPTDGEMAVVALLGFPLAASSH